MRYNCYFLLLVLFGCAANSGVVPIGPDTYMVSRQAASGFSGRGTLKADAIGEADQHCRQQNKQVEVISATEARPPYVMGNFPKAEIEFRCIAVAEQR